MAAISQRRVVKAGYGEMVGVCLADGAWLPFQVEAFDAVFLSFTLELFDMPEIHRVLAGCRRVLVPAGRLGVVAMEKESPPGLAERIYEWFHHKMPVLVDCRPIEARAGVEAAGFTVHHERQESMWGLPVVVLVARF